MKELMITESLCMSSYKEVYIENPQEYVKTKQLAHMLMGLSKFYSKGKSFGYSSIILSVRHDDIQQKIGISWSPSGIYKDASSYMTVEVILRVDTIDFPNYEELLELFKKKFNVDCVETPFSEKEKKMKANRNVIKFLVRERGI
jgi:hypothetical protein